MTQGCRWINLKKYEDLKNFYLNMEESKGRYENTPKLKILGDLNMEVCMMCVQGK